VRGAQIRSGFIVQATRPLKNKERREPRGARLPSFNCSAYFLHPEQDAQQSAEGQHDAFAACVAPAKPNAITATNRIALILFMDFLLCE